MEYITGKKAKNSEQFDAEGALIGFERETSTENNLGLNTSKSSAYQSWDQEGLTLQSTDALTSKAEFKTLMDLAANHAESGIEGLTEADIDTLANSDAIPGRMRSYLHNAQVSIADKRRALHNALDSFMDSVAQRR